MVIEKDFQIAKNNPRYRKKFIKLIDLGEFSQYVQKVNYDPYPLASDSNTGMRTLLPRKGFPFYEKKPRIKVFPQEFSACQTVDDFLSSLLDHECLHAKQWFDGKWFAELFRREDITEREAYKNQIRNFPKRNCSQSYILMTNLSYAREIS